MKLNQSQINEYHQNGFILLENHFSNGEINSLISELTDVFAYDTPRKILDKEGSVRTVFAPEETSELYASLVRSNRLITPAEQLLGSKVYAHQTKLNSKKAFVGDRWDWHQDFTYWHLEDGMLSSRVVTAMVYLDEVNEFNGPLLVIPGSHKSSFEDSSLNEEPKKDDSWYDKYQKSNQFMNTLTVDLKYTIKRNTLEQWVNKSGIVSTKGPKGSVLFFHGSLYHSSSNNLSPWDRNLFLITYNSVENRLVTVENPRPSYIANRDFTPIEPVQSLFKTVGELK